LLRQARLKSESPITCPQSPAVPQASTSARHRSEAEALFAEAKQAISGGNIELGMAVLDQTETLAGPLPQILLTRINALRQARLWPEALRRSRELLNTHPNSTDAHLALGFIHLLQGHWINGWREREWRWQHPGFRTLIPSAIPIWDGSHQASARLWIRCEQGYGDFLQFCRILPEAAVRVDSVVVTVPPSLQRLAQSSFPQIEFQPEETAPPADTWISLMSLPDRLQWIPPEEAPLPYLQVDPPLPARQPHSKTPVRRIGWVSAGNPEHFNDRNRSLGHESLGQFRLPASIQAFRVQPDTRLADELPFRLHAPEIELNDFSDTARWLETLDLVITVDTSVAHLAGGLGIPVWILLPYAPDWRWGTEGETTRWYRSARLFRQPRPNDWLSVLQSVQESLETLAA
jgi:hypothetical protein